MGKGKRGRGAEREGEGRQRAGRRRGGEKLPLDMRGVNTARISQRIRSYASKRSIHSAARENPSTGGLHSSVIFLSL